MNTVLLSLWLFLGIFVLLILPSRGFRPDSRKWRNFWYKMGACIEIVFVFISEYIIFHVWQDYQLSSGPMDASVSILQGMIISLSAIIVAWFIIPNTWSRMRLYS